MRLSVRVAVLVASGALSLGVAGCGTSVSAKSGGSSGSTGGTSAGTAGQSSGGSSSGGSSSGGSSSSGGTTSGGTTSGGTTSGSSSSGGTTGGSSNTAVCKEFENSWEHYLGQAEALPNDASASQVAVLLQGWSQAMTQAAGSASGSLASLLNQLGQELDSDANQASSGTIPDVGKSVNQTYEQAAQICGLKVTIPSNG
jgi:hypothetical protein